MSDSLERGRVDVW